MMLFLRIVVILAIQSFVLFSMVYDRAQILETGDSVILRTEPVDPRSLFRGYYVDLNYEISTLTLAELEGDKQFEKWDAAYITLEKRNGHWSATGVYRSWPSIIGDQVVIKGTVRYIRYRRSSTCQTDFDEDCADAQDIASLNIDFGIESYFIPEGDGAGIENAIREGEDRVHVDVAINDEGRAVIKGMYLDDQLLYKEPPY